jgi:cysteinyl-tRNA synthetase
MGILCLIILFAGCIAQYSEDDEISPGPLESPSQTPGIPPESTPVESSHTPESTPPESTPPESILKSVHKIDLWDVKTGPHLRGANIHQRRVYPELDGSEFMGQNPVGTPFTQKDFDELAALGCNYVNISHPGLFTESPPYTIDKDIQNNLDTLLTMIAKADMFAVISFRTGPGRSEFTFVLEDLGDWFDQTYLNDSVWQDQKAQAAWVTMWEYTAQRYKDNVIVAGYDLMVEPNSNETGSHYLYDPLDIWDPEEFYDEYAGTLYDWNQLYPEIIDSIRKIDPHTPILVGGNGYSALEWLPYLNVVDDDFIVYTAHQYAPFQYTHQWQNTYTYPGRIDTDWDGQTEDFDRKWLENKLVIIDQVIAQYQVPVAINEYGVVRWVPGAAEFMDDSMDLFEQKGVNYALWEWRTWEPYTQEVNAFNFLFGPDPDTHNLVPNDLRDVIIKYWELNTVRPSTFYKSGKISFKALPQKLAHVSHWLYYLDVNLEPDTVEKIASSIYDMVVIDYIPSEEYNTDYPMANVITQFHTAVHPKLVLAYIDIGEAEEYRTYWKPHWRVGNPIWIAGDDPDGWEENYPVAYWYPEWKHIWLGESGILQGILDAGFDGVYLDWIEAYSDHNVIKIAEKDGIDPVQEMITWVKDICDFTRAQDPDFIVIGQNAAELCVNNEYINLIDAVAQEQVWFDGGADNDPPGDCPLPRTDADIDTAEYRASLSEACRHYLDTHPESTLHTSSEEYLYYLTIAKSKGNPIFTVDYALDPENIAWVYKTARALGFIPFVSNRALNQYVNPYPLPSGYYHIFLPAMIHIS